MLCTSTKFGTEFLVVQPSLVKYSSFAVSGCNRADMNEPTREEHMIGNSG